MHLKHPSLAYQTLGSMTVHFYQRLTNFGGTIGGLTVECSVLHNHIIRCMSRKK